VLCPEDLPHIVAISKGVYVYEGISVDYLVDNFPRWVVSPARRCYGLFTGTKEEPEQKMICFHCDLLLDEGTTIFIEGLRTLADQRGTGLRSTLNAFIAKERKTERYGKVKRIRKAIANVGGAEDETDRMLAREQNRCQDAKATYLLGARSLLACRLNSELRQFITSQSNTPGVSAGLPVFEYSPEQLGDQLMYFKHFIKSHEGNHVLTTNWICYNPTSAVVTSLNNAGYGGWPHRFWGVQEQPENLKNLLITSAATVSGNHVLIITMFSTDVDVILSFLSATICGSVGHPSEDKPPIQYVHLWFPVGLTDTLLHSVMEGLRGMSFFRSICIFMETPCTSVQQLQRAE